MKWGEKKWVLPAVGAAGLLLVVLGIWGGRLPKLSASLSDQPEAESRSKEEGFHLKGEASKEGEGALKYDASLHARAVPLRDPFASKERAEADKNITEKEKAEKEKTGTDKVQSDSPHAEQAAKNRGKPEKEPPLPILKGILILGDDRCALIDYDGSVSLVREGEQLAKWTVSSIGENSITLLGVSSALYLTAR